MLVAYSLLILTLRMADSSLTMSADDDDLDEEYPKMDAPEIYVERTLAIFKPDVVQKGVEKELEEIILNSGFTILQVCTISSTTNFLYALKDDMHISHTVT